MGDSRPGRMGRKSHFQQTDGPNTNRPEAKEKAVGRWHTRRLDSYRSGNYFSLGAVLSVTTCGLIPAS